MSLGRVVPSLTIGRRLASAAALVEPGLLQGQVRTAKHWIWAD